MSEALDLTTPSGRAFAGMQAKKRYAPSSYPLAAIARGAVRSADGPGRDRAPLHVLARGLGADSPAAARRQSARVRG